MNKLVMAAAVALTPAAAMAWTTPVADPYGAQSIARNDYAATERRLVAAVARGADQPEILLNLAAIYRKTGRTAEAKGLYERVLTADNVDMATLTGTAWSHDLATRGLARLNEQLAAR